MATVLHRTTKELKRSVNTPDFPKADWIINPDLAAVSGFPPKHWAIAGDTVRLMSPAARDAVDAQEEADAVTEDRAENKARIGDERALKALAFAVMDEINILRQQHNLADRTPTQLVAAIRAKVDAI